MKQIETLKVWGGRALVLTEDGHLCILDFDSPLPVDYSLSMAALPEMKELGSMYTTPPDGAMVVPIIQAQANIARVAGGGLYV